MYVVRCRVSGGVTGTRESLLKKNGEVQKFASFEEAEAEAKSLRNSMNHEFSRAIFEYWVARA